MSSTYDKSPTSLTSRNDGTNTLWSSDYSRPKQRRFVNAAYKRVQADVVLAPQIVKADVEPIPEHKLVIEVAGKVCSSAASFVLAKTGQQDRKMCSPAPDKTNAHRSEVVFSSLEEESKSLYLQITCQGEPTPISLHLADDLKPVEKDSEADEWNNVLIPVLPLYQSAEQFRAYTSGYIYVLWNGALWRELEVQPTGYFCDLDVHHQHQPTGPARHVNIYGIELFPEADMAFAPFTLNQDGQEVLASNLNIDGTLRVFNLGAETVDIEFPHLSDEPITLETEESPYKAQAASNSHVRGFPLANIWVPYKLNGELQDDCYLYFSPTPLSDDEVARLEADYTNMATPLTELSQYSVDQCFSGEHVIAVPEVDASLAGNSMVASQRDNNVAVVVLNPPQGGLVLRYKRCAFSDQSNDFFMLKNEGHDWKQRAYFRSAPVDEDGYYLLKFLGWPEEVETVDIYRGSHSGASSENVDIYLVAEQAELSELLAEQG